MRTTLISKGLPMLVSSLLVLGFLVSCGAPQEEQVISSEQVAADEQSIQAAEVPTSTPTPENTPTSIPTSTPLPSATPTQPPTPTPTPVPVGGGGLIAFSSTRLGSRYENPAYDVVLLDPNTGELNWLTNGEDAVNSSPAWSPDGENLVFTKNDLLYTMGTHGQAEAKVESPFGSSVYHPSWSQEDDYLVSYSAPGKYPQLWQAQAQDLEWEVSTPEISFQFNSVWSPDGSTYAFSGSPGVIYSQWFEFFFGGFRLTAYDIPPRDIYLVDAGTGEMTQLTTDSEDDYDPAWSPDGQKLAYVSVVGGSNPEIFVIDRDGSNKTRLTTSSSDDIHPTWSPDGSKIVFASNMPGNFEIYIIDASGGDPIRMTNSLMDDFEPVWSPYLADPVLNENGSSLEDFSPEPRPMSNSVIALEEGGLLTKHEGRKIELEDFDEEWAQINWYQWLRTGYSPTDFVIRTDASWESASDKANWFSSGCGFVFREKDADNHYVIYLSMDGIVELTRVKNGNQTVVGRSKSRYPVEKPADSANLMLAVQGDEIMFFVDGYLMLHQRDTALDSGNLALTLMSGTNKDFGTRCTMENIELWELRR